MMDALWHGLLGSFCALCQVPLSRPDAHRQLCRYCLADLPWHPQPESEGRRQENGDHLHFAAHPTPQTTLQPNIHRTITPLAYSGDARRWVLEAKRENGLIAARLLGVLLEESLLEAYPFPAQRPTRLIPVPLSSRRLRERGHNQAALIAAPVARGLRIRLDRTSARRIRHTPIQPGMNTAARAANLQGAFSCHGMLCGERVAIIDDVLTTGATSTELARVLLDAGAAEIHLWCATVSQHSP